MRQSAVALVNIDTVNSNLLRERLLQEVIRLERDLEQLQCDDSSVDRSMEQTYREMIHSRRELLATIPG